MKDLRFILGSGRSGTTWVLDALAEANNLRPVFEPLHPAVSDVGERYAYRALAAGDDHPELEEFFDQVAAGRKHKWWTQYRLPGDRLVPDLRQWGTLDDAKTHFRRRLKFLRERPALVAASRRTTPLVKCIRANLMLGWMARHPGARVLLMLRHPGAVVESQLRLGRDRIWDPAPVLERYRNDSRLHELTEDRYRALLGRKLSRIEALTANWVLENQWPVANAIANGVEVVYYERLKSDPDVEWRRACRALGLQNVPNEELLRRPSQQSSPGSSVGAGTAKWRRSLTAEQVDLMQALLDEAEFQTYDMHSDDPHGIASDTKWSRPASGPT